MKKSSVILMWGTLTAIVNSLFYWVINGVDNPNKGIQYVSYLIIFGGLFVGTLQYRKANEGFLSFGQGYKAGILMTLIIAVISCISFAIFLQVHPEFPDKMMEMQRIAMVNRGMPSEQMDMALNIAKKFTSPPIMMIFALVGSLICGAIISLLTAGICSKTKPLMQEDDNGSIQ
jgi:hypothetical protein